MVIATTVGRILAGMLLSIAALRAGAAQEMVPVLRYTPPADAFRSSVSAPAEDYGFNGFNASVQVYPFRQFTGNIEQAFQTTLLRDWITPMHREENVGGPPNFARISIPGAQEVLTASFNEAIVGLPKPHMRMLIIVGNAAAIVDASAATAQSWQMAIPHLNAMAATLRVESVRGPPALTQAAGRAVAGLYMGTKPKYTATMQNVTGYATYVPALHFYLFSADGRVYRAYDRLDVPGGNIARFDFDAAERRDPGNSGRYTVDGSKLIIQMGGPTAETILAEAPKEGLVTISTVLYKRQ
jgi:hypothetical protein